MATRFRFRLEPLLKLRKSLEQEARRQFAKAMEAREAAEAHLKEIQQQHKAGVASRTTTSGQEIDLDFWADLERYLVVLEKRIAQAQVDLNEAEAAVVQARQALTKAHQDHLTLLRLKERRQELHSLEALQEEIREADEIAVLRHRFTAARTGRTATL